MKMPSDELIDLVPKEKRKEAKKLLKATIKLELNRYKIHIHDNICILTGCDVDHYQLFSVRHDSEIDGG